MPGEYIISGFGLQLLKPRVFNAALGEGLGQRKIEYPEQDVRPATRMDEDDDEERLSWLGTPVFSSLTLFESEELNLVIDTVLLEVVAEKIIVKTTIQGGTGTVKEYIGTGDYAVNVKGAIFSNGNKSYPKEDVQKLIKLIELPKAIQVTSPFLQLFGIYNIVIDGRPRFPQREGFQNVQLFEFDALSDAPVELIEEV